MPLKELALLLTYMLGSAMIGKWIIQPMAPHSNWIPYWGFMFLPVGTILSGIAALFMGGASIVLSFVRALFHGRKGFAEFLKKLDSINPPRWPFFVVMPFLGFVTSLILSWISPQTSFVSVISKLTLLTISSALIFMWMAGNNWANWLILLFELGDVKTGTEMRLHHNMPDLPDLEWKEKEQKTPTNKTENLS